MNQVNYEPADITIYARNKGIVVKEKSVLALYVEGKKVVVCAVGNEALTGRFPEKTIVVNPFHQSAIDDFTVALKIMKYLMKKALAQTGFGWNLTKPVVGICIPRELSLVDIKAYQDLFYCAGAKDVVILPQPLQEFLATASEEEKKKYKLIVSVAKDNPLEYVRERVKETIAYAESFGISRETLVGMMSEY